MYTVNDDVTGVVGLNKVVHGREGYIEVNPMIGVRYEPLESQLAKIEGRHIKSYNPVTVNTHLGYLMPEGRYVPWIFPRDNDHEEVASRLAASVEENGFRFFRMNTHLEDLARSIQNGKYCDAPSRRYRLPVALPVMGWTDAARDCVLEALTEVGTRTDDAAEDYRAFSRRFLDQLSSAGGISGLH